jgi:hypothetical protein
MQIVSRYGILRSASSGPSDAQPRVHCTMRTPARASRSPPSPLASIFVRARSALSNSVASSSPDASPVEKKMVI